jgi:tetratricopeptide (TPR) repeat protein
LKLLILVIISLLGSTAFAAKVNFLSTPEGAEVFVINPTTGKKKPVGKTPYTSDFSSFLSQGGENQSIQVMVSKPGYEDFNIVVPPISSSDVRVNANLQVEKNLKLATDFDFLVTDLFDALRMTRLKDFESSNQKLDLLIKKFPHFSVVYEMKGMNFYLKKDFKKALNFYKKAFSVNPKNREAYRMMTYLEKKFNINKKEL